MATTSSHSTRSAEDRVVHDLTTLIQKSGDKIMKEQTKLVLSLPVLNCLNRKLKSRANRRRLKESTASSTATSSVDDIVLLTPVGVNNDIWLGLECRNAEDELSLVEDFLERLTTVKVTQGFGTVQGSVDFSPFASLKALQLKRVPIHLIVGLQSLRPHLKLISCSHCLQYLEDLFASCGGDRCSAFAWPELLSVTLTYNTIDTIGSSLRLLPSLVSLDLSHNRITDTGGLEFLTELQFLNLSFNRLQHLPILGSRARLRLKVISVRNNCLESLEGIESFLNLQQADLAFNCLLDHCSLAPFLSLPHVVLICLEGNPISFHAKHRLLTAEHLHKSSLFANCTIDTNPLTNAECAAVNKRGSSCRTWKHKSSNEIYVNPAINAFSDGPGTPQLVRPASASGPSRQDQSTDAAGLDEDVRKCRRRPKKCPLIREVSIDDDSKESHRESDIPVEVIEDSGVASAKEEMERFRQRHGKEWLVVGSQMKVLTPVTIDPGSAAESAAAAASAPDTWKQRQSQISDDVIVLETECEPPSSSSEMEITTDATGYDGDNEAPWKKQLSQEDESAEEDCSDEAVLPPFIVQMEKPGVDSSTTVLVVVSDRELREKDALTGRTTERLDLRSICSVESLSPSASEKLGSEYWESPRIKIGFSYVRKDRRERIYTMEDAESHQQFLALLKPLVDAKTLEEITLGALQCLKCSAQFSKEVANRVVRKSWRPLPNDGVIPFSSSLDTSKEYLSEASSCPNCASEMLVEIHERSAPPPLTNRDLNFGDVSKLTSGFESNVQKRTTAWDVAPLTKGLIRSQSGDVRQRSRRSSNVLQVEVEIHASYNQHQSNEDGEGDFHRISSSLPFALRRSGSEITILSNPSQSSIMVVANPSVECANLDAISETNSDVPKSPRIVHESDLNAGGCSSSLDSQTSSSACTALEKSIYDSNLARTPDSFRSALSGAGKDQLMRPCSNASSEVKPTRHSPSVTGCSQTSSSSEKSKNNSFDKLNANQEVQQQQYGARDDFAISEVICPDLQSNKQIQKTTTWSCRDAQVDYSFSNFGDVDHRLRLFFDMEVLSETEELIAVLRAAIVPYVKDREFPGLLVVSSSMVHILRIVKEETDQPHDWLQKYESKPLATLSFLNIRLGNQAFQLEFGPKIAATCYTFLLRDADHCNNFVTYFIDKLRTTLEIPESAFECGLDGEETLQIIREHLLPWKPNADVSSTSIGVDDDDEKEEVPIILYLMCYWKPTAAISFEPVSLAMTAKDIYVFREDLHWPVPHLILPQNDVLCRPQLTPIDRRAIQDLTSLEQSDPNSLEMILTFLDDDTQEEVSLHLAAETAESVHVIVHALKEPWEKLFGVELQINLIKQLTTPL